MIMETEALIAETNKAIRRIVRENDLELKNLRKKTLPAPKGRLGAFLMVALLLALLLLSYPLVRSYIP